VAGSFLGGGYCCDGEVVDVPNPAVQAESLALHPQLTESTNETSVEGLILSAQRPAKATVPGITALTIMAMATKPTPPARVNALLDKHTRAHIRTKKAVCRSCEAIVFALPEKKYSCRRANV
jgi:hypothetical protein